MPKHYEPKSSLSADEPGPLAPKGIGRGGAKVPPLQPLVKFRALLDLGDPRLAQQAHCVDAVIGQQCAASGGGSRLSAWSFCGQDSSR